MGRPAGRRRSYRGVAVGATVLLTLALLALLPQPGYRFSRLAYFALVAAVAWIGAAGAVWRRPRLLAASAVGLFGFGFWQFTIGLVMVPTAFVHLVVAMLLAGRDDGR